MLRVLLVALALTASGCGAAGGGAGTDDDVTLLLGTKPAGVHAGIYLAKERGFDEAQGLDLTIRRRGDALRLLRDQRVFAAVLDRPLPDTVCVMAITQTPRPGHFVCVLKTSLEDQRATVRALIQTLQRGYTEAEADPESAVQAMLSQTGGLNEATLSAQLDAVSPSFEAGVPAFGFLRRDRLPAGAFETHLVGRCRVTEVLDLARALVAIDSVNPSLVPGGAGEAEIAAFVAGWARDAGLEVEVIGTDRPSVICRTGRGSGRTLLLCGHLDVVGVAGMADPFVPRVEGDRLYGRGAYDMKGGLAAALVAATRIDGDVIVAAVADEEHSSLGVQAVLETVRADAAIVTEPTEGEVVIAHKGFAWVEVSVPGVAAHGSRPHLGVDAIVAMAPVLTRLGELDARLPSHPLLGRASVHASTINGGEELSSYPALCTLAYERRTLPGETVADVEAEAQALVAGVDGATARVTLVREPFAIDPAHWLVEAAGGSPVGAPFWADSAFLSAAGIPTVLLGPTGAGAHAVEEWVSIASLEALVDRLVRIAGRVCG